jgi:hypothetical protein
MTRVNLFLTAFFRTKHHHLRRSLCGPIGYHPATTVGLDQQGDEEHAINIHSAQVQFRMDSLAFDQHTKATGNTTSILMSYYPRVRVVVMMRNIMDTLYACKSVLDEGGVLPGVYAPSSWVDFDEPSKWRWIVLNVTPWLLSFYVSWKQAEIPRLIIWHEDYVHDAEATLGRVLDHLDYPHAPKGILRQSLDHQYGPNVGSIGEGKNLGGWYLDHVIDSMQAWGPVWEKRMREDLLR